jgi:iron-sulfur cluster assembly accessory protein|tara:strand:- start:4950 stop:5285 length:336 start_codon:yes stop_codon:yes gene_type:complete
MKPFDITTTAKTQIEKLLTDNPGNFAVSLSVKGGGCAGFKYQWGFAKTKDDVEKADHTVEWENGRFTVDATSLLYVMGTTIDYKQEVFGSQFEVINPNATSSCGCGESFGV